VQKQDFLLFVISERVGNLATSKDFSRIQPWPWLFSRNMELQAYRILYQGWTHLQTTLTPQTQIMILIWRLQKRNRTLTTRTNLNQLLDLKPGTFPLVIEALQIPWVILTGLLLYYKPKPDSNRPV
jgi:hypothetical protein